MAGLLDNFNDKISGLSEPARLGLLSTGLSLLEGQPIAQSINTGLGTYAGIKPKNKFRIMSPDELPESLRNTGVLYQKNEETGQITAVSGSSNNLASILAMTNPNLFNQTSSSTEQSVNEDGGNESSLTKGYDLPEGWTTAINRKDLSKTFIVNPEGKIHSVVPSVGTDKYLEREKTKSQTQLKFNSLVDKKNMMVQKVNEAINLIDNASLYSPVAGFFGSKAKILEGTDAYTMQSTLKFILSNLGLSELISLKEQGGTMGALNEKEFAALEQATTNLDQGLKPEELRKNLLEVVEILTNQSGKAREALLQDYPELTSLYAEEDIIPDNQSYVEVPNIETISARELMELTDDDPFNNLSPDDLAILQKRIDAKDF